MRGGAFTEYNVIIDAVSAITVGIILFAERGKLKSQEPETRLLRKLMLCVLTIFLLDVPGLLLDGASFKGARELIVLVDTAYWLPHAAYGWLWLMFSDYRLNRSEERLKKYRVNYAIPMIIETVLVLINPVTGWIFTINADNCYTVGYMYYLNMTPYFSYIAAALVLTLRGCLGGGEKRRRSLLLLIYMLLPVCGVVLEVFAYGVNWVWPLTTLSLLIVYVSVQQQSIADERVLAAQEREKTAKLEKELTDSRIKIMLSQIQPHFLYNSLAVIEALCDIDPGTAAVATRSFSDFLRGNMDSLTVDKPIAFEQELEHTKNYLYLEKLRFEDRLQVEYDIQATRFRLPTLSLQPIAENAVRYGVTKREGGGTVKIASRETADSFVVTVYDNGVGFDTKKLPDDTRSHVGMDNVRNRLCEMCGGTLTVKSMPGEGTLATITVPKQKEKFS